MNLKDLHKEDKPLQTKKIFTAAEGVISIQLKYGGLLKEHVTMVPALLICVTGQVVFENEQGTNVALWPGDYVNIEANVKHWITANEDSNLVLIK
jgi:quercetin dioxygenase-like cupin family protein